VPWNAAAVPAEPGQRAGLSRGDAGVGAVVGAPGCAAAAAVDVTKEREAGRQKGRPVELAASSRCGPLGLPVLTGMIAYSTVAYSPGVRRTGVAPIRDSE